MADDFLNFKHVLSLGEIESVLDKEIGWCNENPLPESVDPDFRTGFIAGLAQAKYLISEASKVIESDTDQQKVYTQTVLRGYREGWTPEQFLARQISKLAEELAEVVYCVRGLDTNLALAILHAGSIARTQFDDKEYWQDNIEIKDGIESEIADCQVVVFNMAESLTEITGQMFDVSEAAVEKSSADKERGVRKS